MSGAGSSSGGGLDLNVMSPEQSMYDLLTTAKMIHESFWKPDGTIDRIEFNKLVRIPASLTPDARGIFSIDMSDPDSHMTHRVFVKATSNITPTSFGRVPLCVLGAVPVIVFWHGGSFVFGSVDSPLYDMLCLSLVYNSGAAVVVSVCYKLAPEHKYPDVYVDGLHAVKWVNNSLWAKSGIGKKLEAYIYLAGDSAGGNIVHHVAVKVGKDATLNRINIMGNILLQPMFGGNIKKSSEEDLDGAFVVTWETKCKCWKAFLPQGEDRDHPACNIFGPRKDNMKELGFPKTLMFVGGLDLTKDWQDKYLLGLQSFKFQVKRVYLEGGTIGCIVFPEYTSIIFHEIQVFIYETMGGTRRT